MSNFRAGLPAPVHPVVVLRGDHNQCPTCAEFFNSTAAFDRHRVGAFRADARRCLTPSEMEAKGMARNASGFWIIRPRGP